MRIPLAKFSLFIAAEGVLPVGTAEGVPMGAAEGVLTGAAIVLPAVGANGAACVRKLQNASRAAVVIGKWAMIFISCCSVEVRQLMLLAVHAAPNDGFYSLCFEIGLHAILVRQ